MISRWRLGYVEEAIEEAHEKFVGRVTIPYYTPAGYSSIVFRCTHLPGEECKALGPHHKKYMAPKGIYRPMFNAGVLTRGHATIFLTEGEINAMVSSFSDMPAVGLTTNLRWEPHWSFMFDGPTRKVALCDGDEPGEEFGQMLVDKIGAEVVQFPSGTDVASFNLERGSEALVAYVKEALELA